MRHRRTNVKFSRPRAQRNALIRSLLRSLIIYESIQTTQAKAKGLRPWVDKLIEWGKDNTIHTRRLAYQLLNDHRLVKRLFDTIAPRYTETPGGYTRIIPVKNRPGDGAMITILELTKKTQEKKTSPRKKTKGGEEARAKPAPSADKEKPAKGKLISGVKGMFKKKSSDKK